MYCRMSVKSVVERFQDKVYYMYMMLAGSIQGTITPVTHTSRIVCHISNKNRIQRLTYLLT